MTDSPILLSGEPAPASVPTGPRKSTGPHVVVVGGGFGGMAVTMALADAPVQITLIDRTNHHLFQPLLYQVAMAGLSPAEIAWPIRSALRDQANVDILLDEVTDLDLVQRRVHLHHGMLPYDYLVIAAGGRTGYFGHPEWERFAPGLKDVDDALKIRSRVLLAFEAAERELNPSRVIELLTFVVVGGGPTGVELAGALAELSRTVLSQDFRHINPKSARVILLEGGPRVLSNLSEALSQEATQALYRLGVEVQTQAKVTNIDETGVTLGDRFIASRTVLWAAGVEAAPLTRKLPTPRDRAGRLIVEPDLTLPGFEQVYAIGDITSFKGPDGNPLPGVSPVAMQMGRCVAQNIRNALRNAPRANFQYVDKGAMATIGRKSAVARLGKLELTGLMAWLVWLAVHIFFLISVRNRVAVMFNWAWNYFTYQRGARLITGKHLDPGATSHPEAGDGI